MSYPSPYQPPTPQPYPTFDYYQPDLLAPARRASVLMFVLGGLAVASALCCAGVGAMLPRMMGENPAAFAEFRRLPNVTPETMQAVLVVMSAVVLLVGVAYLVLGAFVRAGRRGAIITSIVLSILAILLLGLNVATGLMQSFSRPQTAVGVVLLAVPLALLLLLVRWLLRAARAPDAALTQQYAAQYWQYQQQQAYAQQYGYGQPPPPPGTYGYPRPQPPPPQAPQPGAGIYPPSVPPPWSPTAPPPEGAADQGNERPPPQP